MNGQQQDRSAAERSRWIREAAERHGFLGAGIARAERMEPEAHRLEEWLEQGNHGKMAYMANHFDLRVDPTRLVPGARSVISLLYNYFPGEPPADGRQHLESHDTTGHDQLHPMPSAPCPLPLKVSRYAYGEDYHKVLRRKLKSLVREMQAVFGDFQARVFVDSGPVLERDWARRSGLGWVGRNTMLIHPRIGSYFFLAEIILDLAFEYDHPIRDHCGTCTRCIEACPTEAISPKGYWLDGSKCISYLTIELRESIPEEFRGKMEGWIFGCDICQEVCPWNRFSTPHRETAFLPDERLQQMTARDWEEMTEEVFRDLFDRTPVKRAGYDKLKETIRFTTVPPARE